MWNCVNGCERNFPTARARGDRFHRSTNGVASMSAQGGLTATSPALDRGRDELRALLCFKKSWCGRPRRHRPGQIGDRDCGSARQRVRRRGPAPERVAASPRRCSRNTCRPTSTPSIASLPRRPDDRRQGERPQGGPDQRHGPSGRHLSRGLLEEAKSIHADLIVVSSHLPATKSYFSAPMPATWCASPSARCWWCAIRRNHSACRVAFREIPAVQTRTCARYR